MISQAQIITPTHVMADLETLGNRPGSAIAAIGAVTFDPVAGVICQRFYRVVSLASCEALGLTIDASTVLWWLGQSEDARKALREASTPLKVALEHFNGFWQSAGGERLWGHGGNFDEPMLAAAYRAAGMRTPWKYSQGRCTRTIYELAGVEPDRTEGVHHNALTDAERQAEAVIAAYRKLGLSSVAEVAGA